MSIPSKQPSDKELIEWVNLLGPSAPWAIHTAARELKRSLTEDFKVEQRKILMDFLNNARADRADREELLEELLEWIEKYDRLPPEEICNAATEIKKLIEEDAYRQLPEHLLKQLLDYRKSLADDLGAQILTGNLLEWTEGNSAAALASRYNQVCRLKIKSLSHYELLEAKAVANQAMEVITHKSKLARLEVVSLEIQQQLSRLKQSKEALAKLAIEARSEIAELAGADEGLASTLAAAIQDARNRTGGYVYLKQWTLADGTRWLKIGITSNPNRREAEQNVLPVPAVTLRLMETQSMDQAAAIEKALHQQLAAQKVTGAGNRELFHLDDAQLAALMAAMDS